MKKQKTFRIIKQSASYSKKKGMYFKRYILSRNLPNFDAALAEMTRIEPEAKNWVKDDGIWKARVHGLLHPTTYEIR